MWKDAADALKWIAESLLKRHAESSQAKRQKWLQVSDYLDSLAKLIDASAEDFENKKIPHGHYAQLYQAAVEFSSVLDQVYADRSRESYETSRLYERAFMEAVHLIEEGDAMVVECVDEPFTQRGQKVLNDLQAAAGRFRGLAMTIRARA